MRLVSGDGVLEWLRLQLKNPAGWAAGAQSIGVLNEQRRLVAGAVFENFNGVNIFVHIVLEHPRYAQRLFRYAGHYVFCQLGCRRLTLVADATNVRAVRLHEKLGGVLEGRLVGASRTGTDILVFRLTPEVCPVRRLLNGKVLRRASST